MERSGWSFLSQPTDIMNPQGNSDISFQSKTLFGVFRLD